MRSVSYSRCNGSIQSNSGFIRRERKTRARNCLARGAATDWRCSSGATQTGGQAPGQKIDEFRGTPGSIGTNAEVLGQPAQPHGAEFRAVVRQPSLSRRRPALFFLKNAIF